MLGQKLLIEEQLSSHEISYNTKFDKKKFQKWSIQENRLYVNFLLQEGDSLATQFERRSRKIFSKMSTIIKTRSPEQCRTHHQKMILGCRSIPKIIQKIQRKEKLATQPKIMKKRGRKPKNQTIQIIAQSTQQRENSTHNHLLMFKQENEKQIGFSPQPSSTQNEQQWIKFITHQTWMSS